MTGLSRRLCWGGGCASVVAIGALLAILRPEYFDIAIAIDARSTPATLVEPIEPAVGAAAVAAVDSIDQVRLQELYHLARDDVLRVLDKGGGSCENWRKTPQQQACIDPSQCGKGWLFGRKDLLLAVVFGAGYDAADAPASAAPTSEGASEGRGGGGMAGARTEGSTDGWIQPKDWREGTHQWRVGTPGTVTVVGLREGGGGELSDCDSRDLSMLLRLQGPEALAEPSTPVPGRCAWTAEFRPLLEGVYALDVTLVDWQGGLEAHPSQCNEEVGQYGEGSVEMEAIRGVPFYGNSEGCCALCSRRKEDCVAWSATTDPAKALVNGNRCVLYSSVVGRPDGLNPDLRSGTPRREDTMMYLGPSMTIDRRWCAQENGAVYVGSGGQFTVTAAAAAAREEESRKEGGWEGVEADAAAASATRLEAPREPELPLCRSSSNTTRLPEDGRWVRLEDVKCDPGAQKMDPSAWGWPTYSKDTLGVTMPEECFLKPMVERDSGDLKYAKGGHSWQPYDCRYDLMNAEARLGCLRDKNVTRFLDYGDSLISTSRAPRSALWMPTANVSEWSNGRGASQIGPGAKAAGCVGGPIQYYHEASHQHEPIPGGTGGRTATTTTRYCGVEAYWQNDPGQLRPLVSSFKPDVVLANWALVHRLWHHTFKEFETFLQKLGKQLDAMTQHDGHTPRHMFWLSSPFLVSEREPHCVLERGLQYTRALRHLLEPRGWVEIEWTGMTRKWSVDILDGMHHGQPPTRMLAYLLMHHVCHASESEQHR